jgi:hypothetical protein
MKKFVILFFICISFLTSVEGFSAIPQGEDPMEDFYNFAWTGSEKEIYLHINISEGLTFEDGYYSRSLAKGQWNQVTCVPVEGYCLVAPNGNELKKMTFDIFVMNTENPNELSFKIKTKCMSQHINDQGLIQLGIHTHIDEGFLDAMTLDASTEPEFVTFTDVKNLGVVVFKTL